MSDQDQFASENSMDWVGSDFTDKDIFEMMEGDGIIINAPQFIDQIYNEVDDDGDDKSGELQALERPAQQLSQAVIGPDFLLGSSSLAVDPNAITPAPQRSDSHLGVPQASHDQINILAPQIPPEEDLALEIPNVYAPELLDDYDDELFNAYDVVQFNQSQAYEPSITSIPSDTSLGFESQSDEEPQVVSAQDCEPVLITLEESRDEEPQPPHVFRVDIVSGINHDHCYLPFNPLAKAMEEAGLWYVPVQSLKIMIPRQMAPLDNGQRKGRGRPAKINELTGMPFTAEEKREKKRLSTKLSMRRSRAKPVEIKSEPAAEPEPELKEEEPSSSSSYKENQDEDDEYMDTD